jgi:hypothetical protein
MAGSYVSSRKVLLVYWKSFARFGAEMRLMIEEKREREMTHEMVIA